jgi:Tfp pilus assembly protein FimV
MESITIKEAAQRLALSELTIRRRLHTGLLTGHKEKTPQGFVWMVELPDDVPGVETKKNGNKEAEDREDQSLAELVAALSARVEGQQELIEALQSQIQAQKDQLEAKDKQIEARGREVQELHVLLQQAQAALPVPRENRSWWQLWRRG